MRLMTHAAQLPHQKAKVRQGVQDYQNQNDSQVEGQEAWQIVPPHSGA